VTGSRELNNFDPGDGDFAIFGPKLAKNIKTFGPAFAGLPYMGIYSIQKLVVQAEASSDRRS
jgi:hypothetical protein